MIASQCPRRMFPHHGIVHAALRRFASPTAAIGSRRSAIIVNDAMRHQRICSGLTSLRDGKQLQSVARRWHSSTIVNNGQPWFLADRSASVSSFDNGKRDDATCDASRSVMPFLHNSNKILGINHSVHTRAFSTTTPPPGSTAAASLSSKGSNDTHDSTDDAKLKAQGDARAATTPSNDDNNNKSKPGFQDMMRKYGGIFVGTYLTVYVSTLGVFFLVIDNGLMDPAFVIDYVAPAEDGSGGPRSTVEVVVEVMNHYAWTKPFVPFFERNPGLGNLGVAWIAVKFTEPIRFGFTVATMPTLVRYFGRKNDASKDAAKDEESNSSTDSAGDSSHSKTP